MKILSLTMFFFLLIITASTCTAGIFSSQSDNTPWSIMFYSGRTAQETIGQIVEKLQFTSAHESIYSAELAYSFYTMSWAKLQVAGNLAERFADQGKFPINSYPIPEFDAYLMLRITKFPWNRFILTTFAAGYGTSFAAEQPFPERYQLTSSKSQSILAFLAFELTFSLPDHPQWQFLIRIHHRSGCFGLYMAQPYNSGSNNIGIGIRYYFR